MVCSPTHTQYALRNEQHAIRSANRNVAREGPGAIETEDRRWPDTPAPNLRRTTPAPRFFPEAEPSPAAPECAPDTEGHPPMRRSLFPWRAGFAGLALALASAAGLVLAAGAPDARAQATPKADDRPVTQRTVMAYYHYSFQGDNRKQLPKTGIRTDKGLSLLTNHPWESVGPWMSYDRAQWHKNQFQMMAAGGIDVALAVYKGDKDSRRGWALKGLDVMTQGLKELRSEGLVPLMKVREYPQIALALDL